MIDSEESWWSAFLANWPSKLVAGGVCAFLWWAFSLNERIEGSRSGLYTATASLHGTLLGFSIAASTFVLGVIPNRALKNIRRSRTIRQLNRIFLHANLVFLVAVGACLVALVVDRDDLKVRGSPCFMAGVAAAAATGAAVAILGQMFHVLHSVQTRLANAPDEPSATICGAAQVLESLEMRRVENAFEEDADVVSTPIPDDLVPGREPDKPARPPGVLEEKVAASTPKNTKRPKKRR